MTIRGQQIDEGAYPLIPGALISSKSGSELYSVVASDGVNTVSFPRARYYYLGSNIIHEQHSCALSIPPKYQFLTTQLSDGKYTLHFCDSEGKLLTVDDVVEINHGPQGPINPLDTMKHARVPMVSGRNVLLQDAGPLVHGVEHIISETNLQKAMQASTEGKPVFVLGALRSLARYEPAVDVFLFSDERLLGRYNVSDSVGMLNNEFAAIGLNHNSGVAGLWYFSTVLPEPKHQQVKFTDYPTETANAAKSALYKHHIYLVVEDENFYLSEAMEGNITDDPEQALSILGRAHLIAEREALDPLPGKYSFRITVDGSSTRIGDASHKGAYVLSDVAVLVGEDEIPIRAPSGDSLLVRNFLLEHSKTGNDGPVLAFQKNLSNHALGALIGNHFALQVQEPGGQALSYISAAGRPILPGINPVTALHSRTARSIPHEDHDEEISSQVVTEATVQSAQQPGTAAAVPADDGDEPVLPDNEAIGEASDAASAGSLASEADAVTAEVKDPLDSDKPVLPDSEASDNAGAGSLAPEANAGIVEKKDPVDHSKPVLPDSEASDDADARSLAPEADAGIVEKKDPVDLNKPVLPDSGADLSTSPTLHIDDMLLEDVKALASHPPAASITIPHVVTVGLIVPGKPIYDVEAGKRIHPAVFLPNNSKEEYEFPPYSYNFEHDNRLAAHDMYGGKVELSPEYRFLKVVREKNGSDGVLYKLAFCDVNGSAVDPRAITHYSRDDGKVGAYSKMPPQQILPSSILDVQLVANDSIKTSLKDLYKAQGSGPAITLHKSSTNEAVIAIVSAGKEPNKGEIIGKLNEDVVYFDVYASSTNYTHHFHYG
ncbi:MAG: hypothetical protein ACTJLL_01810, partial [Anaplasma sp.]